MYFHRREGLRKSYLGILIIVFLILAISNGYCADSSQGENPTVFRPDEIQHGFSQFESLPDIPLPTPNDSHHQTPLSQYPPPSNTDEPPKGLFHHIQFAKGFEEDEGIRRGHFVVPVGPTNIFHPDSPNIFLVFTVHQHYTPYEVFGRLYPENVEGLATTTLVDEDAMRLATEDESGYLHFASPTGQWQPGTYRVEVFIGFQANDNNLMGTMRFSVVSPPSPS